MLDGGDLSGGPRKTAHEAPKEEKMTDERILSLAYECVTRYFLKDLEMLRRVTGQLAWESLSTEFRAKVEQIRVIEGYRK